MKNSVHSGRIYIEINVKRIELQRIALVESAMDVSQNLFHIFLYKYIATKKILRLSV